MNIINKYRFPVNFNDINKCQICGSDYYLIFNDSNNNNENINCYKSPEKYYLDNDNLKSKSNTSLSILKNII